MPGATTGASRGSGVGVARTNGARVVAEGMGVRDGTAVDEATVVGDGERDAAAGASPEQPASDQASVAISSVMNLRM